MIRGRLRRRRERPPGGWDTAYDDVRLDLLAMERAAAPPLGRPVTDLLRERLAVDRTELEAALDPEARELWDAAPEAARPHLELALALHAGLPGAAERTGLSAAMPPADVHAMAAGPAACGGSSYHADLVAEAVTQAGGSLTRARVLDFGCSSGRVVRVLRAAYPEAELSGCDPIDDAVDWARANLPGIAFGHQGFAPPLPYADDAFDVAYAISIWSHFGPTAGPAWLGEMARIVRPGGLLVMTTQGWHTLGHLARHEQWGPAHLGRAARELASRGFHYHESFGPGGDFEVEAPGEWGMAYLSLEWLMERAGGDWSLVGYAQGRNEGNQDVVVLRRR